MSERAADRAELPMMIALIGPDGAGKSTVARRVAARLPLPTRYLYMGVNLDSSREMLPTTRLALALKRRAGGRPDLTGRIARPRSGRPASPLRTARGLLRIGAWMAEEWYRAALAAQARRSGRLVICDRHFVCDYYASDIRPGDDARPLAARLHGAVLRRWYPRPDLTLLLDAPAEVLLARKGEGTLDSVEQLRADYHALAGFLPAFEIVDADRPLDAVVDDIVDRIVGFVAARGRPVGDAGERAAAVPATDGSAEAPATPTGSLAAAIVFPAASGSDR